MKVVLFLLFVFCCLINSGAMNQPLAEEYPPCDNQILFVIESSLDLSASAFQKQIDFLTTYVFEKWTHFGQLALFDKENFGGYKKFGSLNSTKQVEGDANLWDVLFYFDGKKLISSKNKFAFIPLSSNFNDTVLNHYFKQAKFIEWDINNNNTPTDWEKQFNTFYDCENNKATTLGNSISATTENPFSYPPCSIRLAILFDKSSGFTDQTYQQLQKFLIENIFRNWTRFDNLNFFTFADHTYSTIVPFNNKDELVEFIQTEEQINSDPDFCNSLSTLFLFDDSTKHIIIFLSKFNKEDFEKPIPGWIETCQEFLNDHLYLITFVFNNEINTDLLRENVPRAHFIKLNLPNVETNWEWPFLAAYGCNEENPNDQTKYPSNSKFIIGYDVSSEVNETILDVQRQFLINNVFTDSWNVFKNLALIAYSNETQTKDFGSLNKLEDVHSFIDNSTEQNVSRTSLCDLFKLLTTFYLREVNVILFVNEFHQFGDECSFWIQQLRDNVNSVNFVNLTAEVDVQYLLEHLPQAIFTSWDPTANKVPDNWSVESYGCQGFFTSALKLYPCGHVDSFNVFAYDRSRYLNPFEYQRLTKFLLTNMFIKQWTYSSQIYLYTYPDIDYINKVHAPDVEFFIRKRLKSKNEPSICELLNSIEKTIPLDNTHRSFNLTLFLSKTDESITDNKCDKIINQFNVMAKWITFIKLHPLNDSLLQKSFPNSTIVEWNIEKDEKPLNWSQMLWNNAFGCSGDSPLIFPQSTSTVNPTTKALTSTVKHSTVSLSSTTQVSTTKSSTSTLTTTTAPIPSTKQPDSGSKSKETILLGVFIPLIIIILIAFILIIWWCRKRNRQKLVSNMASNDNYRTTKAFDEKREEDQWELGLECLQINFLDKLGSGAFGDVYLGKINGPAPITQIYNDSPHCQRFNNCEVAIKSLPQMQIDEYARNEFWKEIEFMKGLKFHQNLVCFLGYVYDPTSPLMLLEYCANGDLLKFIKTNKQKFVESFENQEENTDCKTLISFAWQISSGLEYLSSLDLIHRDIAARNILLDSQNVCKVSDFGLCRTGGDGQLYLSSGGKLPVKWMAIESLKENIFSTKTDVWSYGVLLWELFTLGSLPYAHIDNVLKYLDDGKRLEKPNYCSEDIYDLMSSCWQVDPDERPTFTELCQILAKMIETATMHYNYVDTLALIEEANIIEEIDGDSVNI